MAIHINNKAGAVASRSAVDPASPVNDLDAGGASARVNKDVSQETSDILSVSASFQAKVKSLDQLKAQPPKEDNIAIDGELKRMGDMLARMKTLSIQAKSIPLNPGQQEQLHSEFAQLKNEIQRYSNATRQKGISIPYDPNQDNTQSANAAQIDEQEHSAWLQNLALEDQRSVETAIETLDTSIEQISQRKRSLNGIQDRLTAAFTAVASLDPRATNTTSIIQDISNAAQRSKALGRDIIQNAHDAYNAQTNQDAKTAISLLH